MTADLARITYDPTRQYRSLIAQQGRVTLEADSNEAAEIAGEALRLETIDIIGPTGAAGAGYLVGSGNGPGGASIGPGVFYLGGWRLELDAAIDLSSQPDWQDAIAAPSFRRNPIERDPIDEAPREFQQTPEARPAAFTESNALVALLLSEQSICAVEDQALREVALGGPDSAARGRLMQHFLSLPLAAADCASGAGMLANMLQIDGVTIDPATLQLLSSATLQAGFVPGPANTDPCTPTAAGGYLGADNQLVRVTVTEFDAGAGTGTLLWGWNNASLLYRAGVTDPLTLTLTSVPVDEEHAPQSGQAVEILRSANNLGDGNYIAAAEGFVTTLTQAYSFDTGVIVLQDALPADFQADPNPLFVRLWQAEVPFTAGAQTALDATSGIVVTLSLPALPTQIAARPFWRFAVRPFMPQNIYPQRYADTPQPPDGPRQWITALGVVQAGEAGSTLLADCRVPFLPLTRQSDCTCCSLALDPDKSWFTTLNTALNDPTITALDVCFQPGVYTVPAKITATGKSVKMTGAGAGTQINGPTLEAVLEFDTCTAVTLSDLCVTAGMAGYVNAPATKGLQGAVTIRGCNEVVIERVVLACADADLRSASCLAVYNPTPTTPQQYDTRILNSRFLPGHAQVGILLVNADRAQVEGNVVLTPVASRNVTIDNLPNRPFVAAHLRRQLVRGMTVVQTAKTARVQARERRVATDDAAPKAEAAPAAAKPKARAAAAKRSATKAAAVLAPAAPRMALAEGFAHVRANFGTVKLQFQSSNTLGTAWNDALGSKLGETSKMGAVHKAVAALSKAVVKTPFQVAPAFRAWLGATLPGLCSTASQGIVVGGTVANDIRILNNTIDGSAQGIHVALSAGISTHYVATRVQIIGNTVNVRVTIENSGDRHGIYLGRVTSGVIADNHMQLSRVGQGTLATPGIKIGGGFGPLLLIERNATLGFSTGIWVDYTAPPPATSLWKAADNSSDSPNILPENFRQTDNTSLLIYV